MKKSFKYILSLCFLLNISCQTKNEPFEIADIVKDFKNDNSIKQISGIQTDQNLFYIEYFVYVGKKDRVLTGINKIKLLENKFSADSLCHKVDKKEFLTNLKNDERYPETKLFWNFENLKDYDVYSCTKNSMRHYIIFDNKSDTIYHRMEEVRD